MQENPRACGVKWQAKGDSYINDVKFFGGHGNLVKGTGEFEMPYDEGRARDVDVKKSVGLPVSKPVYM